MFYPVRLLCRSQEGLNPASGSTRNPEIARDVIICKRPLKTLPAWAKIGNVAAHASSGIWAVPGRREMPITGR
jgi:hypothetical protein